MKKLLLVLVGVLFAFNANATTIPEGAIVKTANNPDVYIIKYKNGKQFKRLVLNPQVFESYGHLRWEDILVIDQTAIDSFATSDLVRVDGQTDIYQLVPNGDVGTKVLLTSTTSYDLDLAYTINAVDFGNYTTKEIAISASTDPIIKIEKCKAQAKYYADQKAKSDYLSAMIRAQEEGDSETAMFYFEASIKPEHPHDYDFNYQIEYISCLDS